MFRPIALTATIAAALLVTDTASADEWTGEASVTGSNTTGNTETTDVGLGIRLQNTYEDWRHKIRANADYGKVSGFKNKKNWSLGYQLDKDINDRFYVYGTGDYYQDDFGAYKQGYFLGGGAGYKLILPKPISWNLEAGPGYRSQKIRLAPGTPGGAASENQDEVAVRAFSDFDWQLNDNVSFYNDTEVLWSKSDTYIWDEVGITATLMGNLAARASFRVDHHTDVPFGLEKTDTTTRVGIVYTID